MVTTKKQDEQIANMVFAKIYPLYLAKVVKKDRTEEELVTVISWLTGYSHDELKTHVESDVTIGEFFGGASLHANAHLITGKICGYRVEDIQTPLTQQARYLDKLVDELAKGRKIDKILRTP